MKREVNRPILAWHFLTVKSLFFMFHSLQWKWRVERRVTATLDKEATKAGKNTNSFFSSYLQSTVRRLLTWVLTLCLRQHLQFIMVLHDISRRTLCFCSGWQFYPNKRGRKHMKVLQLRAGGQNMCYWRSTVKGSSQAATAFPTSVHTLSAENLLARTQDPPFSGLQSAGTWAWQPVDWRRVSMSHSELTKERS